MVYYKPKYRNTEIRKDLLMGITKLVGKGFSEMKACNVQKSCV